MHIELRRPSYSLLQEILDNGAQIERDTVVHVWKWWAVAEGQEGTQGAKPGVCELSKGCRPDQADPLAASATAWAAELAKVTSKVQLTSLGCEFHREGSNQDAQCPASGCKLQCSGLGTLLCFSYLVWHSGFVDDTAVELRTECHLADSILSPCLPGLQGIVELSMVSEPGGICGGGVGYLLQSGALGI